MDEERAQIEEVLQRGEEMLHLPMEDNTKEKIRLQLLLLHTRYNKAKVRSWESAPHMAYSAPSLRGSLWCKCPRAPQSTPAGTLPPLF